MKSLCLEGLQEVPDARTPLGIFHGRHHIPRLIKKIINLGRLYGLKQFPIDLNMILFRVHGNRRVGDNRSCRST